MTVKPVLVKSKGRTNLWAYKGRTLRYNETNFNDEDDTEYYQLVFISADPKEKINVGDVYLMEGELMNPCIDQKEADRCNNHPHIAPHCTKVIVTQDQIPESYIQRFVDEYNKGKVKDVELEMITMNKGYNKENDAPYQEVHIPKLILGHVSISDKTPILYTEDEVKNLIKSACKGLPIIYETMSGQRFSTKRWEFDNDDGYFDSWFERNKKK